MTASTDRRPRVLHLGPDVPGGMRTVLRGLLASPLVERYQLDVVASHRGAGAARRLTVFAQAIARLAWWSLRRRGRVVHIHSTVRGSMYRKAVLVLFAKAFGRKVVLHIHSGPGDVASFRAGMSGRRSNLLRRSLRRADVVLAVSEASRVELEKAFGLTEIEVIPNAAPPLAAEPAVAARREGRVVFLGGFANPVKGGEQMLGALRLIEPGELEFVLAGPGDPPPTGQRLLDSRTDVEWLGWLDGEQREEVLASASIFVLASVSEGLPMALLEAMSRGQAIAATEVGGVPDVLDDEAEGLLVAPGDPAALATAITRLGEDPELRERLGRAAHARAATMGADRVAARIGEIYGKLLEA